jgi:transcriptional regulator with XRE-family HTH domain
LKALGERIRDFRSRKRLSQETLAFEIGVHRTYIGLIEQARRFPSMQMLIRISRKLDVTLADLLSGVEERARVLSRLPRPTKSIPVLPATAHDASAPRRMPVNLKRNPSRP